MPTSYSYKPSVGNTCTNATNQTPILDSKFLAIPCLAKPKSTDTTEKPKSF